jgi:hypothetical protein
MQEGTRMTDALSETRSAVENTRPLVCPGVLSEAQALTDRAVSSETDVRRVDLFESESELGHQTVAQAADKDILASNEGECLELTVEIQYAGTDTSLVEVSCGLFPQEEVLLTFNCYVDTRFRRHNFATRTRNHLFHALNDHWTEVWSKAISVDGVRLMEASQFELRHTRYPPIDPPDPMNARWYRLQGSATHECNTGTDGPC